MNCQVFLQKKSLKWIAGFPLSSLHSHGQHVYTLIIFILQFEGGGGGGGCPDWIRH